MGIERTGRIMPEDSADIQFIKADQRSREKITASSNFIVVTDKAPVVFSWDIINVAPRSGLIRDAVVQRTMQAYGTYYSLPDGVTPENAGLRSFGVGLEDKLPEEPKEGMARYFAKEGKSVRDNVLMAFPSQAEVLDRLVEEGLIQDSGSEFSRIQLNMLVRLDNGIKSLASKINRNPYRSMGDPSYDKRKKLHDYLVTSGISEDNLIEYRNGNRLLALPKERYIKSDGSEEVLIVPGDHSLSRDINKLNNLNELRDWKFLRSAMFLLSDPKAREVLEVNRLVSEAPRRVDDVGRIVYSPTIKGIVEARLSQKIRKQ